MSEDSTSGAKGRDAFQLFPDIMSKFSLPKKDGAPAAARKAALPPPGPPDINWLGKEEFAATSWVSDIPTALLLMPDGEHKTTVAKAFEEAGYLVQTASSEQEAVRLITFGNLKGVVLQTDRQKMPLEKSVLHSYMRRLAMSRRRSIYYVLIGPDYHTLFDLEALSLSVNLVVNDRDVHNMGVILRKGLQEHENLFGPLLLVLNEFGRR